MAEDVASDRWGDEGECEGSVAGVKQGEGAEGAKEEQRRRGLSAVFSEGRITGESPRAFPSLPLRGVSPRFLVLGLPFLPIPAP